MSEPHLHVQYESLAKQSHAAVLGMWTFLASEVLLFSALFALYAGYRVDHPELFAEAAGHNYVGLGAAMTLVLLTSSLAVALAVGGIRAGRRRWTTRWLAGSALLGALFLGLKLTEYWRHVHEGILPGRYYASEKLPEEGARLFFTLYYLMTGLHALHVAGGVVLLAGLAWWVRRGRMDRTWHTPVELGGLYWHLVDVIWLFLWPLLYLVR